MRKLIGILFITLLLGGFLCSSCKLLKHIQKNNSDSTNVKKENVVTTHVDSSNKKSEAEWWREIYFGTISGLTTGHIKDTNVTTNNYYPSSTQLQPIYIREGGKLQTIESHYNYDSANRALLDSMNVRMERYSKDSKTTVLNFWQILGICAGVCLFFFLITKLKIGIK